MAIIQPITVSNTSARLRGFALRFGKDNKIPTELTEYLDGVVGRLKTDLQGALPTDILDLRIEALNHMRVLVDHQPALLANGLRSLIDLIETYAEEQRNVSRDVHRGAISFTDYQEYWNDPLLNTLNLSIKDLGSRLDIGLGLYGVYLPNSPAEKVSWQQDEFPLFFELRIDDYDKFIQFIQGLKDNKINLDDKYKEQLSIAFAKFLYNISNDFLLNPPNQDQLKELIKLFQQLNIEIKIYNGSSIVKALSKDIDEVLNLLE